jgi:hypothetical protein
VELSDSRGLDAILQSGDSIGGPRAGQGAEIGIKLVKGRQPTSREPRYQAQSTINL